MSLSISQPSSGIRRAIKSYCFSNPKHQTRHQPLGDWHVRAVMPHARERGLDHNLVAGMATGSQSHMELAPSRREDWLIALRVLTRRNALSIDLRECIGKRTRDVAIIRHLMGKGPELFA
jgi:hypothetical protein